MTKEMLDNLEKDCKTIMDRPAYYATGDLLNMVLSEDVPELINFARRVSNALKNTMIPDDSDYCIGYYDAIDQIKKDIYGR